MTQIAFLSHLKQLQISIFCDGMVYEAIEATKFCIMTDGHNGIGTGRKEDVEIVM